MDIENTSASFQGQAEGQSPETLSPKGEVPASEPQFLTVDEYNKREEQLYRKLQGVVDKKLSGTEKRVQERMTVTENLINKAKEEGVPFTAQQEFSLRLKAREEALSEGQVSENDPAQDQRQERVQATEATQWTAESVNAEAARILSAHGITIEEGDPEIDILVRDRSPEEYFESLNALAFLKKKRMAPSRPTGNPAAVPAVMGRGTGGNLEAEYQKELSAAQGNVEGIMATKRKYRGLGLRI